MTFADNCLAGIILYCITLLGVTAFTFSMLSGGGCYSQRRKDAGVFLIIISFLLILNYWFGYFGLSVSTVVDRDVFHDSDIFHAVCHILFGYIIGWFVLFRDYSGTITAIFTGIQHFILYRSTEVFNGQRWVLFGWACVCWLIIQYIFFFLKPRVNGVFLALLLNAFLSALYLGLYAMSVGANIWTLETITWMMVVLDFLYFVVFTFYLFFVWGNTEAAEPVSTPPLYQMSLNVSAQTLTPGVAPHVHMPPMTSYPMNDPMQTYPSPYSVSTPQGNIPGWGNPGYPNPESQKSK